MRATRRERAHLVTEARLSKSADIGYRERRYLIMMGIRLVCFVIAVVLFINGAGWLTAVPAAGAIIIPYFAVIFANGSREPNSGQSFQAYQPRLPDRFSPPGPAAGPRPQWRDGASGETGTAGNSGESGRTRGSG